MTDEDMKIYIPRPTAVKKTDNDAEEIKIYPSEESAQSAQRP